MRRALLGLLLSGCFLSHGPDGEPLLPPPRPSLDAGPMPVPGPVPVDGEWFVYRSEPSSDALARRSPSETWALDLQSGARVLLHTTEPGQSVRRVRGAGALVAWALGGVGGEPDATRLGTLTGAATELEGGQVALARDGATAVVASADQLAWVDPNGSPLGTLPRRTPGSMVASPDLRWVLDRTPTGVEAIELATGTRTAVELPGELLGPVRFDARERVAVIATAEPPEIWSLPAYRLHRVDLETFETRTLALHAVRPLAYDPCGDVVLGAGLDGVVRAYGPEGATGEAIGGGLPATGITLGYSVDAALSPDGRHLLWLGRDGDRDILQLTDRDTGTTRRVDIGEVPGATTCCGDVFDELEFGNFVDGAVSLGVTIQQVVPICDCAPVSRGIEPAAYRIDLRTGEATRTSHCGLTVPWLTRDGRLLVCELVEGETDTVHLVAAEGDERESLTDGPWDVGVFPLERSAAACGR